MLDWLFSDPLPTGTAAPDFTALDDAGNQVSLAGLRGRNVVLVFYPGDDTPGCTKQLCEFRDQWAAVKERDAIVFGVNPAGASSHGKFRSKYRLPFPILVDQGRQIAQRYRCGSLIVRRTVYVIGADGVIRFSRRGMPDPAEVLAAIVK